MSHIFWDALEFQRHWPSNFNFVLPFPGIQLTHFFNSSEIDEDEDDDDNDEDSEPILGKWFADTLFPPDEDTSGLKDVTGDELKPKTKRHASDVSGALLVPQKGEPAGFVSLASHVFIFLNKHIVNCESKFVRNYIRAGLTEQQVCTFGAHFH